MVVRRALVRLGIAMGQHDEAEILVLVELARARWCCRPHRLIDERLVGEQLLQQHAHFLSPGRAGRGLECSLGVLDEGVERIGHGGAPQWIGKYSAAHGASSIIVSELPPTAGVQLPCDALPTGPRRPAWCGPSAPSGRAAVPG